VRPSRDEIIEARMLASLALIAEANERSLVEELNLAVRAYVLERMPRALDAARADAVSVEPRDVREGPS
jgi:hypothetical protein